MDKLSSVFLFAGLGCFALAFLLSGLYPYLVTDARQSEATLEELAHDVTPEFKDLKATWPVAFAQAFEGSDAALTDSELAALPPDDPRRDASTAAWRRIHAQALRRGRDIYVADACWHCHSQFVRPVANEEVRFGPVLDARYYNNFLQRPQLMGTRRVGPDLTHEGGKRSNDWHVAHFADPRSTSPGSVMPSFPWFLREGWQVRRRISFETQELHGLPEATSYRVRGAPIVEDDGTLYLPGGIFPTKEAAERERALLLENLDPNLDEFEEEELMHVAPGTGPNAKGLAVIAYLQWLGRWRPKPPEQED